MIILHAKIYRKTGKIYNNDKNLSNLVLKGKRMFWCQRETDK